MEYIPAHLVPSCFWPYRSHLAVFPPGGISSIFLRYITRCMTST
ncbi:hypothetical protein CLOBOL_03538 [Enterocloster bolteae ATCC BAA-613]|uniref:Uncharacterized protein n=1 Tax=Enterocloster bolteae (strain ATCC BAA-613 / DSM 15670 / CCUG 46953 / JCM 12243 / WAL 16351) TaxID=411902 RepID=A8RT39_ENTBW|nr:hypothetical protein CLOBOL_03538 [Enterocloster bolteae ATCC BAA-613]